MVSCCMQMETESEWDNLQRGSGFARMAIFVYQAFPQLFYIVRTMSMFNNIYTYDKNFLYTLKWLWKGLLRFSHENNKQSHKQQLYWQTKVVVGHFSTPWPTTEAVYSEQNSLCALTGYEVSKDVSKLPSNTASTTLCISHKVLHVCNIHTTVFKCILNVIFQIKVLIHHCAKRGTYEHTLPRFQTYSQ